MITDGPDAIHDARAKRAAESHAATATAAASAAPAASVGAPASAAEPPLTAAAERAPPPSAPNSESVIKSIDSLFARLKRICVLSMEESGQLPGASIPAGLTLTAAKIGLEATLRDAERELRLERVARIDGAPATASAGQLFVEAPGAVPGFSTKRLKPAIEGGFGRGSRANAAAPAAAAGVGVAPASQPFVQVHKQPGQQKKRGRKGAPAGRPAAAAAAKPAAGGGRPEKQRSVPQQQPNTAMQQPSQAGSKVLGVPGEQPPQFISAGETFTWSTM